MESGQCSPVINLRYQDGSKGSSSNPENYKNQSYAQLKSACLSRGHLFVDEEFPPESASLGTSDDEDDETEWLRPAELLKRQKVDAEPLFCVDGAERYDFKQGNVGNCWFISAISALTVHKSLLAQVVPMEQSFSDYAGIFHFRFWRFGKWVDVVIDDLLPVQKTGLVYVHKTCKNEFWAPLVEKAYAKVCGTYSDMKGGFPSEAFKNFCGGVSFTHSRLAKPLLGREEELWLNLTIATQCISMICCWTRGKGADKHLAKTGLVYSHAYSITGVTEVEHEGSKVKLVRVMNPWGGGEWVGKWSDKSDVWTKVSEADQAKWRNRHDGEFWMDLEDFRRYFDYVTICSENPNFLDGDFGCQWKCMIYDGSWVAGRSAGGSMRDPTSFATNPQYRIQVKVKDEQEPDDKNFLLSLMQKPEHERRKKGKYVSVGLTVFRVPPLTPQGRLSASFFENNKPIRQEQTYARTMEVIEQHSLEPGEYVVVPSTKKAFTTGEFVLTVYTKADTFISPFDGGNFESDDIHGLISEDEEGVLFGQYADQNERVSANQLQKLLNEKFPPGSDGGFGLDTCRSMIALIKPETRGRMNFADFVVLWTKIVECRKLFMRSDSNRKGSLSDSELQAAFESAGIKVTEDLLGMMIARYSDCTSTSIQDFIAIMLRLTVMSEMFRKKSGDGMIMLIWEEWAEATMYT